MQRFLFEPEKYIKFLANNPKHRLSDELYQDDSILKQEIEKDFVESKPWSYRVEYSYDYIPESSVYVFNFQGYDFLASSLIYFNNVSYLLLLFFICVILVIFTLLFVVSYFIMKRTMDLEKLSAYECGFDPFEESLGRFDIKFYLVAILFLVFDLEIVFLFPWSIMLNKLQFFSFWIIFYFLFVLLIGFVYEWRKGALDWN